MLHKDEIKNGKGFDFCFKMVLVRVRLASCRKMPRIVVMCAFVPRRSICNNCQGIGAHTFFMDGYNRAAVAKQISLYTHSHTLTHIILERQIITVCRQPQMRKKNTNMEVRWRRRFNVYKKEGRKEGRKRWDVLLPNAAAAFLCASLARQR